MMTGRLPDGFLDELKARLRPSDVIGRSVKLTRRGKEWVGLSPFTNEKTPSFYVNDQKKIFKCFSSGLGGDIIKFVQETERLSFMEAVEKLAGEAGMQMPTATPEERQRYDRLARLKQACAAAAAFFRAELQGAGGGAARRYLEEKRALPPKAWARWQVGYAPDDWRALRTHLKGAGFSDGELEGAGLIKTSEKGGEPYDVFRNRIMFPISDTRGEIIAFGGRALDPEDKAKYLNSPETELFHKSSVVYNYAKARESIGYGERGGLIVCEGYMDVIALGEAGFHNAVAPLGTALTERQLRLIWKAGPDPILCFDGDAAGLRAAHKALDVAMPHLEPGRSAFVCLLPEGLDPDDVIRGPDGTARMGRLLEGALPLVELLWRRELGLEPLDTPERKAGLEARLIAAAETIRHPGVRTAYIRDLRARLRDYFWQQGRTHKAAPRGQQHLAATERATGLLHILRAVDNSGVLDAHIELLARAEFPDADVRAVRDAVIELLNQSAELDRLKLRTHLATSGKTRAVHLLDSYPVKLHMSPDTPEARDWLIALEQYAVTGEPDDEEDAEAALSAAGWRRLHRKVAERPALAARRKEAAARSDQS